MPSQPQTPSEKSEKTIPLPLTEEAKKEIHAKGFYLYKWISSEEVKTSIQRDYLAILSHTSLWIGGIAIFAGVFGGIAGFFVVLGIAIFFILAYIFFLTIRRSLLLTNTANVVLTDSAISFGGEIIPYANLGQYRGKIEKWEKEFDEPLFETSHIAESKNRLFKKVVETIALGWKKGFELVGKNSYSNGKNNNALLFVILLGVVYTLSLVAVYIGGLFFLWMFSLGFTIVNRVFLRLIGHTVQRIHDLFTEIDISAGHLRETNKNLSDFFTNARENAWQDALLTKIQDGIKNVNSLAQNSLKDSEKLREILIHSEYRDVFNFDTYSGWIRTQIILPLHDIRDLLAQNHLLIARTIDDMENQISTMKMEEKPSASALGALEAQKIRLEMQEKEIEKNGNRIEEYLEKLEGKNR